MRPFGRSGKRASSRTTPSPTRRCAAPRVMAGSTSSGCSEPPIPGSPASWRPGCRGFLLDLDDHLLCPPAYLDAAELPHPQAIEAALTHCRVRHDAVRPTRKAPRHRAGLDLGERTMTCPNAVPFGASSAPNPHAHGHTPHSRSPARPRSVAQEVLAAIADGAARHHLPLWALGATPPELHSLAAEAGAPFAEPCHAPGSTTTVHSPDLQAPWCRYPWKRVAMPRRSVRRGQVGRQDGRVRWLRTSAVYSRAVPYEDSDLSCGRLAPNDYAGWSVAIDEIMDGGWRTAGRRGASGPEAPRADPCGRGAVVAGRAGRSPARAFARGLPLQRDRARTRESCVIASCAPAGG